MQDQQTKFNDCIEKLLIACNKIKFSGSIQQERLEFMIRELKNIKGIPVTNYNTIEWFITMMDTIHTGIMNGPTSSTDLIAYTSEGVIKEGVKEDVGIENLLFELKTYIEQDLKPKRMTG
jgi:hypothetical protein